MKKGTAIIAIGVVALLVGGGIAAAGMMGLFGEKDNKVSFDKNYFDLSGAKSLAIKQDNQTSSKVNAVSLSTGGSVYAFGDDDDDVVSTTFYKKTDSGWVKVRMYTDDSKGEEVSYESSPMVMEVTDDGKFAFMVFGELRKDSRDYRNVTYVLPPWKRATSPSPVGRKTCWRSCRLGRWNLCRSPRRRPLSDTPTS